MGKTQKILIVDDVPQNIHMLMEILRDDYALQAATSGVKAIDMAQQDDKPDLILLDIKMPEMDGIEVIKRLKSSNKTKAIPVIFITALSDAVDEAIGLELGAVDYITKPIKAAVIKARIRTHLELFENKQALESKITELSLTQDNLRKANVRLKELDRLKSMFIASMSHELRTPLNSIIGFTGLLLQKTLGDLNEKQQDSIQRVFRAGKHLLELISDIIDISKIEAGRIDAYPVAFPLRALIDEAIETIRPQADAKDLELKIQGNIWPEMVTDRKRLLQCLLNYLSNSVKFTEKGVITLAVSSDGNQVEIRVTDTGIGIADEDIPKLFEAFERLESHLRVKAGGTGLGLYLTKKIATELLQGSFFVESRVNRGSTFGLRIPTTIVETNG